MRQRGRGRVKDSAITVTGNRHVGADTIRAYFHPAEDGKLDAAALDATLKRLYATGMFQNVKISHDGDAVFVSVVENPTVVRVAFEGNHKIKDADLKKDLQSKESGPLWRAFVQSDVERIGALYRLRGFFETRVVPKTIELKDEGVNLVFEIKQNEKLAVRQIVFAGNAAFPRNKLTGGVKTGVTNPLSFALDNDSYDPDKVANDGDFCANSFALTATTTFTFSRHRAMTSTRLASSSSRSTRVRNTASAKSTSTRA